MPSKDKKVVSTKISDYEYGMLEKAANMQNLSVSAVIGICVKGIIEGDIEIDKGELKTGVDPNGYAVYDNFTERIERKFEKLRERNYPERIIEQTKEGIINGLESQISMMPKSYDPRRMRDDCGC